MCCPGLQGVKIIDLHHERTGKHLFLFDAGALKRTWLSTFSIQIFKNAKKNVGTCTKESVAKGFRVIKSIAIFNSFTLVYGRCWYLMIRVTEL